MDNLITKDEIVRRFNEGEEFNFNFFVKGVYSNFYNRRFKICGIFYRCVEQHMMPEKALMFKDEEMNKIIMDEINTRQK